MHKYAGNMQEPMLKTAADLHLICTNMQKIVQEFARTVTVAVRNAKTCNSAGQGELGQ